MPHLETLLSHQQRAFLRRDRGDWAEHLARIRGFLGEGLRSAPRGSAPLILGAGSGLEVPWNEAPEGTVGWDADPWSRVRTALRHRRWAPWVFADMTGGFEGLQALLQRSLGHPWSGQRRDPEAAAARVAGLLASLPPEPVALRSWLQARRPATILAANVLGQIGIVARGLVDAAFTPWSPWEEDPERRDPLDEALDAWVARTLRAVITELWASGATLWLVHDRGVVHDSGPFELGPPAEPWTAQLPPGPAWELSDPLCGLDLRAEWPVDRLDRWLWPVAPCQIHVMEAVVIQGRAR